jgi:hypothetical protein
MEGFKCGNNWFRKYEIKNEILHMFRMIKQKYEEGRYQRNGRFSGWENLMVAVITGSCTAFRMTNK